MERLSGQLPDSGPQALPGHLPPSAHLLRPARLPPSAHLPPARPPTPEHLPRPTHLPPSAHLPSAHFPPPVHPPLSIHLPVHRGCSLIPPLPRGWRLPVPGPGRQSRDRRPVLPPSIISLQSVSYFPPIKSSATNCMGVDRQLMPAKP